MFDLNKALNEVGEVLFGIKYTGREQSATVNQPPANGFVPKPIKIGEDKARDEIGIRIFGKEYPEIFNRREPAWTDAEWWKVKRFDAAIKC